MYGPKAKPGVKLTEVNISVYGVKSIVIANAEGEINMLIGFFVMNGVYIGKALLLLLIRTFHPF